MSEVQHNDTKKPITENCNQERSNGQDKSLTKLISEIESLDPKAQEQLIETMCVRVEKQEMYSGPIPHPQLLKEYKKVLPDAPNRILQMAERQQAMAEFEQQESWKEQRRTLTINSCSLIIGQLCGFIICVGVLFIAYQLISAGKTGEGLATIITAGAGMAGIFLYTNKSKSKADQNKQ